MNAPGEVCLLEDFGTLRFSGADVETFLQGQLSNDVSKLSPGELRRAGLHNPQGRTLALLWLLAADQGDTLAVLPLELLAGRAVHPGHAHAAQRQWKHQRTCAAETARRRH